MRTCVIVNPKAGSAASETLDAALRAIPDATVCIPESAADAGQVARDAAAHGAGTVIAVGGDGTVNCVVNALMHARRAAGGNAPLPRLGVIPLGTGNDLARTLGMPLDPLEAVEALRGAAPAPLDVVRLWAARGGDEAGLAEEEKAKTFRGGERYYVNSSAGGLVGWIGKAASSETKAAIGPAAYAVAAAPAVADMTTHALRLRIDEEEIRMEATNLIVANGRTIGGGTPVAPDASLSDGLLNVIAVPEMSVAGLAVLALKVLAGQHTAEDGLLIRRARRVRVESDPAMPVNADGEPLGQTPVEHVIMPGALEVLLPAAGKEP